MDERMEQELIRKKPPQNINAEQALIGALLMEPNLMQEVVETLIPEDFYDRRCRVIYESMYEFYMKQKAFTIISVNDDLLNRGETEAASIDYLKHLMDALPDTVETGVNANLIKEKSILRKLIRECSAIMDSAYGAKEEVDHILENAEQKIFALSQSKRTGEFSEIKDVMRDVIRMIEANSQKDGNVTGVSSGFPDLDMRTSGFQNSDLILIAARPAMGKTAFALNLAKAAAMNGTTTAIFSLEMSSVQLGNRLLSMVSGVDSGKLRIGKLASDEWERIIDASEDLYHSRMLLDDKANITISELRSKCRKAKVDHNLGLVIIDYLQLMQGSGRESRQQEISEISRGLKMLAKELNVPVIALSQLSRACETRQDHRPMLSDLRESGAIEQDADIVMFLYRDDYYDPNSEEQGITEVIIAKQRHGATGTVKLGWQADKTRFVSLERTNETY